LDIHDRPRSKPVINTKTQSELERWERKVGYPTTPDIHRSIGTAGHKSTLTGVSKCGGKTWGVWFKEEIRDGRGSERLAEGGFALSGAVVNDLPK
ncbi:hypothetical protein AVEN_216278-1, partial [Araneus ventricosus]